MGFAGSSSCTGPGGPGSTFVARKSANRGRWDHAFPARHSQSNNNTATTARLDQVVRDGRRLECPGRSLPRSAGHVWERARSRPFVLGVASKLAPTTAHLPQLPLPRSAGQVWERARSRPFGLAVASKLAPTTAHLPQRPLPRSAGHVWERARSRHFGLGVASKLAPTTAHLPQRLISQTGSFRQPVKISLPR